MRVIILCGGKGNRWNNFRGTLKQLIKIEGEILLERTYRQFSKYANDIIIVGEGEDYKINNNVCIHPPLKREGCNDLVKFWSSHHLWQNNHRTVLIFGDVYFTDSAVNIIMNNFDGIKFFLREQGSLFTGKNHKEIFAIAFDSSFNKFILNFINQALYLPVDYDTHKNEWGGWIMFDYMKNIYPQSYTNIDDWTEDFDIQKDLENWEHHRIFPEGYILCTPEGGSCIFNKHTDIAYGVGGQFRYLYNQIGKITFNNKTFGDVVPNVVKLGFYKEREK